MNDAQTIHIRQATNAGFIPSRRPAQVVSCTELSQGVIELRLRDAYIAQHAQPAQFVNLYSADPLQLLPRPFGVASVEGDEFTLIFAVVGSGTREFAALKAGQQVDVLGPLGIGFELATSRPIVLVGGGLGVPPLIFTAQKLASESRSSQARAVFGYRDEHFADDIMRPYVEALHTISNAQGNVITVLDEIESELLHDANGNLLDESHRPVVLTCGPNAMMKAVALWASKRHMPCYASMEQRMACGYGTCVTCTVDTIHGRKKVCVDGSVFSAHELGWE